MGSYMSIMIHPGWRYVFWFAVFGLYAFLIKIIKTYLTFADEPIATTAAIVVTILSVSGIATYIEEKVQWGIWNIVRIAGNKWKCLQCGETSRYLSSLASRGHRFMYTCKGDEETRGCSKNVYQCHMDKVKHNQIRRSQPGGILYRVCSTEITGTY